MDTWHTTYFSWDLFSNQCIVNPFYRKEFLKSNQYFFPHEKDWDKLWSKKYELMTRAGNFWNDKRWWEVGKQKMCTHNMSRKLLLGHQYLDCSKKTILIIIVSFSPSLICQSSGISLNGFVEYSSLKAKSIIDFLLNYA